MVSRRQDETFQWEFPCYTPTFTFSYRYDEELNLIRKQKRKTSIITIASKRIDARVSECTYASEYNQLVNLSLFISLRFDISHSDYPHK